MGIEKKTAAPRRQYWFRTETPKSARRRRAVAISSRNSLNVLLRGRVAAGANPTAARRAMRVRAPTPISPPLVRGLIWRARQNRGDRALVPHIWRSAPPILYPTGRLSRGRRAAAYAWVTPAPCSSGLLFRLARPHEGGQFFRMDRYPRPLRDVAVFL